MGAGFVFFIYLIIFAVLSVAVGGPMGALGWFITRRKSRRTHVLFTLGGLLLPSLAGGYVLVSLVLIGLCGVATGHDLGFGDGFDVPLNNHYHWSAIDDTTSASVYDVTDRSVSDGEGDVAFTGKERNAFTNVLQFQQEGDWIAGAYDSDLGIAHYAKLKSDRWFLFNTRTHERFDAENEGALRQVANAHGVTLALESCDAFYARHQFGGLGGLVALILLAPPLVGAALLFIFGRRLWRAETPKAS